MNSSTSFSKLEDETWGVRVATKGTHPSPGDEVQVPRRDGSIVTVTLGAIVDRDLHAFPGPAVYYRIHRNGNGKGKRTPESTEAGQRPAAAAVLPELSTGLFHWHPAEKIFSAEASDLRAALNGGFVLVSAKTGTKINVRLTHQRTEEGELLYTVYLPETGDFTVRIYND